MTVQEQDRRLAPWWAYLIAVVVLNVVRQLVFPPSDVSRVLTVVLFFVVLGLAFVIVTPVWRAFAGSPRQRR